MAETPSKNDPSADWPEEIRQAYEHLKIPSLYDSLLANERLSLEIRRQDRELKAIVEGIHGLSTQFNTFIGIVEEEWEVYGEEDDLQTQQNGFEESSQGELTDLEVELLQENQVYQEKKAHVILMETHDDIRDLSRMTRQVTHQLLSLLPTKEGFIPHIPPWHPLAEAMLQSIVDRIEQSRYQLLARLEGVLIEIVDPHSGEEFNESLHHVLDHISGGKPGTIAQVVRVGYRQGQDVLRLAEVTIYS